MDTKTDINRSSAILFKEECQKGVQGIGHRVEIMRKDRTPTGLNEKGKE